jgi:hypothetical protein
MSAQPWWTMNSDAVCRNCAETPKPAAFCIFLPTKLSTQHFCQLLFYSRKPKPSHLYDSYLLLLELYQITCLITNSLPMCECVEVRGCVAHLVNISGPVISGFPSSLGSCFFSLWQAVYVTAVLHWYKYAPHSNWINVRRTAGSLFFSSYILSLL